MYTYLDREFRISSQSERTMKIGDGKNIAASINGTEYNYTYVIISKCYSNGQGYIYSRNMRLIKRINGRRGSSGCTLLSQ